MIRSIDRFLKLVDLAFVRISKRELVEEIMRRTGLSKPIAYLYARHLEELREILLEVFRSSNDARQVIVEASMKEAVELGLCELVVGRKEEFVRVILRPKSPTVERIVGSPVGWNVYREVIEELDKLREEWR
jgi:hypothetical protein